MPIAIYLRRAVGINRFRDLIIDSLDSNLGTSAILCSGFFQQRNSYRAASEPRFAAAAAKLKNLKTLGIYNQLWLADYKRFVRALRRAHVNVNGFRIRSWRWHAKVYVLSNSTKPILAVIGSSNITRSAFSTSSPFNWECDVAIWSNKPKRTAQRIRRLAIGDARIGHDLIIADYNPKQNNGLTIDDRLAQLISELNEMSWEPIE